MTVAFCNTRRPNAFTLRTLPTGAPGLPALQSDPLLWDSVAQFVAAHRLGSPVPQSDPLPLGEGGAQRRVRAPCDLPPGLRLQVAFFQRVSNVGCSAMWRCLIARRKTVEWADYSVLGRAEVLLDRLYLMETRGLHFGLTYASRQECPLHPFQSLVRRIARSASTFPGCQYSLASQRYPPPSRLVHLSRSQTLSPWERVARSAG